MTGFNYIINLTVLNGSAFGKLASMAGGFENSLDRVQGEVSQTQRGLETMGQRGRAAFDGMRSSVMGWVTSLGIGLATLASLQTAAQNEGFKASIEFSGGADGAKNLAFVRSEVDRLGLPLRESLEGFSLLSGSMMGTGMAAQTQQKIFQGLAEGLTTFRVPAEKANRALLALSQMASKGTVSAEELKGQMGEALPGSFGIAARAMGVTQMQLQKMLEKGEVMANDFLPKFAEELHRSFGQSAVDAANGATATFNRMNNSLFDLKVMVGEQLMPTAISLIRDFLIPAVGWIGRNIDALKFLAVMVGGVWAAYKFYTTWVAAASLVTGGLTGAVNALTVAFYANPIGLIIAAVIAVGAAVYYAWNHFEGFRAGVYGVWEVMKPVAAFLYDVFTMQFRVLGAIIQWVWEKTESFRKGLSDLVTWLVEVGKKIWDNLIKPFTLVGQIVTLLEPIFDRAGKGIGETFTEGWNKGLASFDAPANIASTAGALGGVSFGGPSSGPAPGASGSASGIKAREIGNNITGGGQRNVTINLGSLNQGGITINSSTLREGGSEVEAILTKMLLQVMNSANQNQGG